MTSCFNFSTRAFCSSVGSTPWVSLADSAFSAPDSAAFALTKAASASVTAVCASAAFVSGRSAVSVAWVRSLTAAATSPASFSRAPVKASRLISSTTLLSSCLTAAWAASS